VTSVPEGQYDDERRLAVVGSMTEAVLDAEEGAYPRDPDRVWIFTREVPDGTWGARGQIWRLGDIAAHVISERARPLATEWLAQRRREKAALILASVRGDLSGRSDDRP
jgi:hypothetical protein